MAKSPLVEDEPTTTAAGRRENVRFAQQDGVERLRTLAPASVDLIVTDPPYESLEKFR